MKDERWSAYEEYDEGRIGSIGMHGLKSRQEAIEWLTKCFDWKRCWYKKPSWRIECRKN